MPTRADIISRTSTLSSSETVELTEFLSFLDETFRNSYSGGVNLVDFNHDTQLTRSYSCTPIAAESPFLLVVVDCGTYLIHSMNPVSSRKLTGIDFMYRKKPASRLSRTAIHCHVVSISPLTIQIVDLMVFLGTSLLSQSWDYRLRVAQVELKFPRPEGSVKLEFAQCHKIWNAIDALKQSPYPCMGLYFFPDTKSSAHAVPPAIRWIGSVENDAEEDLFGEDNVEFQLASWMRTSPLPEPKISQYQNWRDDVDKACFGADWISHRSSPISCSQLQEMIALMYPDLEQAPVSKKSRILD